jgi:hypothetical protein
MTTMISIDGAPVAFIGATRFYVTPFLDELTEALQRDAIVALCEAMTTPDANGPDGAFEPRQARTD